MKPLRAHACERAQSPVKTCFTKTGTQGCVRSQGFSAGGEITAIKGREIIKAFLPGVEARTTSHISALGRAGPVAISKKLWSALPGQLSDRHRRPPIYRQTIRYGWQGRKLLVRLSLIPVSYR